MLFAAIALLYSPLVGKPNARIGRRRGRVGIELAQHLGEAAASDRRGVLPPFAYGRLICVAAQDSEIAELLFHRVAGNKSSRVRSQDVADRGRNLLHLYLFFIREYKTPRIGVVERDRAV